MMSRFSMPVSGSSLRRVRDELRASGVPLVMGTGGGFAIERLSPSNLSKIADALTNSARPESARPAKPTPTPARTPSRPQKAERPAPAARHGYRFARGAGTISGQITAAIADSIERDLRTCQGTTVDFIVDSHGGELEAGLRIARAIREHGEVRAHLQRADSAAIAFTASKVVEVVADQEYTVHLPLVEPTRPGALVGTEYLRGAADRTDRLFSDFAFAIGRVSGPMFQLLASEDGGDGRRLTAAEMCRYGFADRIIAKRPPRLQRSKPDIGDEMQLRTQIETGVRDAIEEAFRKG